MSLRPPSLPPKSTLRTAGLVALTAAATVYGTKFAERSTSLFDGVDLVTRAEHNASVNPLVVRIQSCEQRLKDAEAVLKEHSIDRGSFADAQGIETRERLILGAWVDSMLELGLEPRRQAATRARARARESYISREWENRVLRPPGEDERTRTPKQKLTAAQTAAQSITKEVQTLR